MAILLLVPVQLLLPYIGWRGAFGLLALLACCVSLWIRLSVPLRPPGFSAPPKRSLAKEVAEFGRIFAHPEFIRFMPAMGLLSGLVFTYQGLWAGPWLRDVGQLPALDRSQVLLCYALGMMTGNLVSGQLASVAQRRGVDPMWVPYAGLGAMLVFQAVLMLGPQGGAVLGLVWFGFSFSGSCGPASYSLIAQRFAPELVGRVATAMNFSMLALVFLLQNAIGWVLDLWPRTAAGGWDPAGYGWALGVTLAAEVATIGWLLAAPLIWRKG